MIGFEDYLVESLNTPQEYYITDDTKIPERIYASFSVEGNAYIIALLESNIPGIYTLELGRTKEGASKTYWWKYHSSSDILPVLATALQFTQASMAWTQGKMKGVLVKFRAAQTGKIERTARIAEKIAKKAYVNSFKVVPVKQPEEGSVKNKERYVFVMKKSIDPKSVFKTKAYSGYDFSQGLDVEGVEPKKAIKATTTTKASSKYSFGGFDVQMSDEELFDKLENVKSTSKTKTSPSLEIPNIKATWEIAEMLDAIPAFDSMVSKLLQYGFDESKLDWGNFEYVMKSITDKKQLKLLKSAGFETPLTDDMKSKLKTGMNYIGINKNYWKDVFKLNRKKEIQDWLASSDGVEAETTETLDLSSLISTIPGVTTTTPNPSTGLWKGDENYDVDAVREYIKNDLGFEKKLLDMKNVKKAYEYTGNSYQYTFNEPLREAIGNFFDTGQANKSKLEVIKNSYGSIHRLSTMFDEVEPFPEPLWVYRGTTLSDTLIDKYLNVGEDYIDPAFLSTSLMPTISFGSNVRMRIYIPKNSKILPVLGSNLSSNWTEEEVILPPCSVIRILNVEKVDADYYGKVNYVTGALIGSAYPSILEQMKNTVTEGYSFMNEDNKKDTKYDPEGKFGGTMPIQVSKKISDAIKAGKLSVKKPTKK